VGSLYKSNIRAFFKIPNCEKVILDKTSKSVKYLK
jgi:hypothetical protein